MSFQRYHGAHVLLHALQFQTQSEEDKKSLAHYKDAVEKRLHILEQQGYVQAFETITYWINKIKQVWNRIEQEDGLEIRDSKVTKGY